MLTDEEIAQMMARPADALDALDRVDCEESLLAFTRRMWHVLEPGRELVEGWALEAICEHLEAVSYGQIQKLLINVPPGFMKSMLTEVFWPAWEWGPRRMPHLRYVSFSYSAMLTERDNRRFRDVMLSHDYGRLFGDRFALMKTGEQLVSNDKTGWKLATSIGGVGTGERGDRVVLDDPHSVKESESDTVRQETVRWFREGMSNRLNDADKSAVVVIMQRVHEEDVSGVILSDMQHDYEHMCIPMEWEGQRRISTVSQMAWQYDPREEVGDLAWAERFSPVACRNLKTTVGPYAWAGQYQQSPTPRGGGIFKRDWWQVWDPPPDAEGHQRLPQCEFVLASFDGAFGQRQENDYSALTVWGIFRNAPGVLESSTRQPRHYLEQTMNPQGAASAQQMVRKFTVAPRIILMNAWRKRLPLNGLEIPRMDDETPAQWRQRAMKHWGITQWVADTCRRFRVNILLIESKANGIDVANEMSRQYSGEGWSIRMSDPGALDKVARAYSVQHLLADQMVYAPDREWAEDVITEMSVFPKTTHDDYTDTATQAWKFLRDAGLAVHGHELERDLAEQMQHTTGNLPALYPI